MGLPNPLRAFSRRRPWPTPDPHTPWRQARFTVIDVETTGLLLDQDEIVSIGAAEVVEGRISNQTFYEVVKPDRPISEAAMRVHSLTSDDVASAPRVAEVVGRLHDFVDGSVLVAHAAWVERAFLDRALRALGERLPRDIVDTAALARAVLELDTPAGREPALEGLARGLGLPVHTPHHALGDAVTTASVLLVLASRLQAVTDVPVTVGDLLRPPRQTRAG